MDNDPQVRAIVGARVSAMHTNDKLSHTDQRETGERFAAMHGWTVVGSFEDIDVSAIKTSPWERRDLGPWLVDRPHEWDAIIFTKVDRAFRSARDSVDLADWAQKNRKILVFADDGIKLDYFHDSQDKDDFGSMMSEAFLLLSSMFAAIEGKRFQARAQSRVRSLRSTDRWGYGFPPYGFKIVTHPSGEGKALAHDPVTQNHLHNHLAAPLLNGNSLTKIVSDLVENNIPSPRDALRLRKGETSVGSKWTTDKLKKILSSPTTQGIKVAKDKPVLRSDGTQVQVGPPSFTPEMWDRIQQAIAERTGSTRERVHTMNPMLGVGKCAKCGGNLRQRGQTTPKGKYHRYYVCGTSPKPCSRVSIIADDADEIVSNTFLERCGPLPVYEQHYQQGEDHSYELADITRTIESLREDRALGLYSTPEDEQEYRDQMKGLIERRDKLAATPSRPAGWVQIDTGKTYGETFPNATPEEKRRMLREAGIEFRLSGAAQYAVHVPEDVLARNFPGAEQSAEGDSFADYGTVGHADNVGNAYAEAYEQLSEQLDKITREQQAERTQRAREAQQT